MDWTTPLAAAAGIIVVGAAVVVGAMVFLRRRRDFMARAIPAPGVVTGLRRGFSPNGRGLAHYARVGFRTADGRPVSTEIRLYGPGTQPRIGSGMPPLRAGAPIPVLYDPVNPWRADVDMDRVRLPASSPRTRRNARIVLGVYAATFLLLMGGVVAVVAVTMTR